MRRVLFVTMLVCTIGIAGCSCGNVTEEFQEQENQNTHFEETAKKEDQAIPEATEPPQAKSEEEEAAAKRKAELTIDTPYYTVTLPDDWYGTFEVKKDEALSDPYDSGYVLGCEVSIMQNGLTTFFVICYSDNWGTQGTLFSTDLGTPSNLPGYHVVVSHAFDPDDSNSVDRTAEYAQYVTLK